MKKVGAAVRNYYVLPCLLLLLNLANNIISYKAEEIADPFLRVAAVIGLVLCGGGIVGFVLAPGLEALVRSMHRGSHQQAGRLGELLFLLALGAGVFWLYYEMTIHGPEALLPREWLNAPVKK